MKLRTTLKTEPGVIELAPVIDVIFLLLIFFVISSDIVFQPGVQVELPKTSYNIGHVVAPKLILTVTAANQFFLNDNPVSADDLERQLRETLHRRRMHGPPLIVLRADKNIPHGKVAEIMAMARSLKLDICLAIDNPARNRADARVVITE